MARTIYLQISDELEAAAEQFIRLPNNLEAYEVPDLGPGIHNTRRKYETVEDLFSARFAELTRAIVAQCPPPSLAPALEARKQAEAALDRAAKVEVSRK